jgi:hypothetical protein
LILPAADTEMLSDFPQHFEQTIFQATYLTHLGWRPQSYHRRPVDPRQHHARILAPVFTGVESSGIWDEIREKIFKNYALKSMDKVCDKLEEAALYIERNPKMVKSITSFPYIVRSM